MGHRYHLCSNEKRIYVFNSNYRRIQPLYCGLGNLYSLTAEASHKVLKEAIARHGCPEIINSDQGCQFTCKEWVSLLNENQIKISMDGKGRAIDNVYIERFWRTIKNDYVYLHPVNDGLELYQGIKKFIEFYNFKKSHRGLDRKKPAAVFLAQAA